jgi:hypothetical protein
MFPKNAFIMYATGHLLAPSLKHDFVTVDYWGALKSADHIVNYNWCVYVVRSRGCPQSSIWIL